MGIVNSKDKNQLTIDHGSLVSHNAHCDIWDVKSVKKLILQGRLAPFYKGNLMPCNSILNNAGLSELPSLPASSSALVRRLYEDNVECPICLLYYPMSINTSRCCSKPICTECFLQLSQRQISPLLPIACPFCVQPKYGIIHRPAKWSIHYQSFFKRRADLIQGSEETWHRLGMDDPDVVFIDQVKSTIDQPSATYCSTSGTTRRTIVRPDQRPNINLPPESCPVFIPPDREEVAVMEALRSWRATLNNTEFRPCSI
ncbi:hypothetical protein F4703DRAFT_1923534 [Phycomyces blakesleeanus]